MTDYEFIVIFALLRMAWAIIYIVMTLEETIAFKNSDTEIGTWLYREHLSTMVYLSTAATVFLITSIFGIRAIFGIPSWMYYVFAEGVFILPTLARKSKSR